MCFYRVLACQLPKTSESLSQQGQTPKHSRDVQAYWARVAAHCLIALLLQSFGFASEKAGHPNFNFNNISNKESDGASSVHQQIAKHR